MNHTFFVRQALNLFRTLFTIKRKTNQCFVLVFFNGRMWLCWSKKKMWTSWQSSSPMNISTSSTVSSGSWTQTTTSTSTRETWRSTTTKVLPHTSRPALLSTHERELRCGVDACTKHHWCFLHVLTCCWHLQQSEAWVCACVWERERDLDQDQV